MRDDELLLDYMLGQLPEAEAQVLEKRLMRHPALAARLAQLRRQLQPLEQLRRSTCLPPSGLAERTLVRVQALPWRLLSTLPRAPRALPDLQVLGGRFRAEALVAGCLLLLVAGLLFSAVSKLRARHDWLACQNQWRQWYLQQEGSSTAAGQPIAASLEATGPLTAHGHFADNALLLRIDQRWQSPQILACATPLPQVVFDSCGSCHYLLDRIPRAVSAECIDHHAAAPLHPLRCGSLPACDSSAYCSTQRPIAHCYSMHILCNEGHVQAVMPSVLWNQFTTKGVFTSLYVSQSAPE
jgi:hypothetical protein